MAAKNIIVVSLDDTGIHIKTTGTSGEVLQALGMIMSRAGEMME